MSRGRLSPNLAWNLANFAGCMLIGLWFTPYLIRHLGVVGYGLVPLATSLAGYLGVLTVAMEAPISRFLTIALARNESEKANRIFNSGLWAVVGLLALVAIPALILSWKGLGWLSIPPEFHGQFTVLLICVLAMFATTTVGGIFGVSAYSANRFDISSSINLLANLLRVGAVVVLFAVFRPTVWMVGLAMVLSGIASLVLFVVVWVRLTPQLRLDLRSFSRPLVSEMAGFGGWTIINQLGVVLFVGIDLLVVNTLLGAEASARYAVAMTFAGLLRSAGGVVAMVFGPTILALYAKEDAEGLIHYSRQAVKFVGLLMVLPIGLVCGFARPLLGTWLGPAFESLWPLVMLLTFHLCVNLAVLPLFNIQVATGKVRCPGLVTCGMGGLNVLLAVLLAGPMGCYGVALAGVVILTLKNLVFTPLYCAHLLRLPWYTFLKETVQVALATTVLGAMAWGVADCLNLLGWTKLIGASAILSAVGVAAAYGCLLSGAERARLKEELRRLRAPLALVTSLGL
jgi:membrane protein EpsK